MKKVVPLHNDILTAIEHFPVLASRGVKKIKNKVRNDIKRT